MRTFMAQRRLDDDLAGTAMNTEAIKPPTTDVVKQKQSDPASATVYTAEGQLQVSDQFLNACRLLAHHSTSKALQVGDDMVASESLLYVREPCRLYRREILSHLTRYSQSSGFMPPFSSFI
jgi:hypothetical protein